MKKSLILKRLVQAVAIGAALAATAAMAHPGPGMGWGMGGGGGWGGGPGMQRGMGMGGMGGAGGWGMGPGGGRGMMAAQNGAPGWQLMTPEERTAQQAKMRAVKTYDECKAVQAEHRTLMETRAKEKGVTPFTPRGNPCDNLKARGLIQ